MKGDVIAALRRLKDEGGGDILMYGSVALMHALLDHGLVDQLEPSPRTPP